MYIYLDVDGTEKGSEKYCADDADLKKLNCDKFYFPIDDTGHIVSGNPDSTIVGRIMEE